MAAKKAKSGGARKSARKRGRPTSYDQKYCEQARKLCQLGATDIEIADFFGVNVATLNRWKATHPDFRASIKAGKGGADDRVERSLFHRACGYTFDAEEVFQHQGKIVRAAVRKHVPPETGAIAFWLKNRRPESWRDRHHLEHDTPADSPLALLAQQLAGTALRPKEPRDDDGSSGGAPTNA